MQIGLKKPNEGEATPGGDETPKEKDPDAEQPDLKNFTASQLLSHNKFLEEVEKLKNGTITEGEFLGGLQQSQKQGLFHMMEKRRSAAENENWKQMVGPGSKKRKNTHRTKKQFCTQGWNATKDVEWVSWKKVCEEYGEQEAKLRVANHLILTRRCPEAKKKGLKILQFCKVSEKTRFNQGLQQSLEATGAKDTNEKEHRKFTKALLSLEPEGSEEEAFSRALWHNHKKKPKALMDGLEEGLEDSSSEENECGSEEMPEPNQFLAELEGQASSSKPQKPDKATKAEENKRKQEAREHEKKKREKKTLTTCLKCGQRSLRLTRS